MFSMFSRNEQVYTYVSTLQALPYTQHTTQKLPHRLVRWGTNAQQHTAQLQGSLSRIRVIVTRSHLHVPAIGACHIPSIHASVAVWSEITSIHASVISPAHDRTDSVAKKGNWRGIEATTKQRKGWQGQRA